MSDIIVTTPKGRMADAAKEAEDAKRHGGDTRYFRHFSVKTSWPDIDPGDRVYYVEDGFVRGFAIVDDITDELDGRKCDTTGRWYAPGIYMWMRADSWQWIKPIPYRGFQGFHYAEYHEQAGGNNFVEDPNWPQRLIPMCADPRDAGPFDVVILGGWLDPRPEAAQ